MWIQMALEFARDTEVTVAAERGLDRPKPFVKILATIEGVLAIVAMIGGGRTINIKLIFSSARCGEVTWAHLSGMETRAGRGGDPGATHSVTLLIVSRVDPEVDRRPDVLGRDGACAADEALAGLAVVASATRATLLEASITGLSHGILARTTDTDTANATDPMWRLTALGFDTDEAGRAVGEPGIAGFHRLLVHARSALDATARRHARR